MRNIKRFMQKQKKVIQIYKLSFDFGTVSTVCDSKKNKYSGAVCSTPPRQTRLCFKRNLWHDALGRLGKQYAQYCAADSFHVAECVSLRAPGRILSTLRNNASLFFLAVFEQHGNFLHAKLQKFFSKQERRARRRYKQSLGDAQRR